MSVIDKEAKEQVVDNSDEPTAKRRFEMSRRAKIKAVAWFLAGTSLVGAGVFGYKKLDEARESRINTNLETRLHDYGFPFDTAAEPIGKIDVHSRGTKIDVRCGKAAEHVVGFYLKNNGPRDIELYLPLSDIHGNSLKEVSWSVGGTEEVQTFLEETLPPQCESVETALADK